MSGKAKSEVKILKGQEAEDKVLEYLKKMNRPYGAVDVSANLKGMVPKTATQKILLALADKGELVQKVYGKTTFFVANQANIASISAEKLAALETEHKSIDEENKLLVAEVKAVTSELVKLKIIPTDVELEAQIVALTAEIAKTSARLQPLRSGAPLISVEDLAQVDADWSNWRAEWVHRRKIFNTFWQLTTDTLTPQDAASLAEDLGIEADTPEHLSIERSPLCITQKAPNPLKRKR